MKTSKNILILGSSKGLGKSLADLFELEKNYNVYRFSRSQETGELCYKGDVTNIKDIVEVLKNTPSIDEIVFNAGITNFYGKDFPDFRKEQSVINVNLNGFLNLMIALQELNTLPKKIVIISSVASAVGLYGVGAYCASKSALLSLYQSYRSTLKERNCHLQIIMPHFIDTDLIADHSYSKPFMTSPEKAALQIKKHMRKNKNISFLPSWIWLVYYVLKFIPSRFSNYFTKKSFNSL